MIMSANTCLLDFAYRVLPCFFSLGLLISCALAYIYIISFFYCPAMLYILS